MANLIIDAQLRMNKAKKALQNFNNDLSKLKLPQTMEKSFETDFNKINQLVDDFNNKLKKGFSSQRDLDSFTSIGRKISGTIEDINERLEDLGTKDLKKVFQIDTSSLDLAQKEIQKLEKEIQNIISTKIKINFDDKTIETSIDEIFGTLKKASKSKKITLFEDAIYSGDVEKIKSQFLELEKYSNSLSETGTKNAAQIRQSVEQIRQILNIKTDKTGNIAAEIPSQIGQLNNLQKSLSTTKKYAEELDKELTKTAKQKYDTISNTFNQITKNISNTNSAAQTAAEKLQSYNLEAENLKDQVKYWFSLTNVANLFKDAIRDVIQTVSELDSAMAEIAVVTDFSVGDMWETLPEYTKYAKELGVATKELYSATGLYYQQGLNSNNAMAAGVETMKMARIAGMEAADATDAMTAA